MAAVMARDHARSTSSACARPPGRWTCSRWPSCCRSRCSCVLGPARRSAPRCWPRRPWRRRDWTRGHPAAGLRLRRLRGAADPRRRGARPAARQRLRAADRAGRDRRPSTCWCSSWWWAWCRTWPASQAPVAAAFEVLLGPAGVALASVAAMVSIYGWTHGLRAAHAARALLHGRAGRAARGAGAACTRASARRTSRSWPTPVAGLALRRCAGGFAWNADALRHRAPGHLRAHLRRRCSSSAGARAWRRRASALPRRRPSWRPLARRPSALWLLGTRSFAQAGLLLALMAVGLLLWRPAPPAGWDAAGGLTMPRRVPRGQ